VTANPRNVAIENTTYPMPLRVAFGASQVISSRLLATASAQWSGWSTTANYGTIGTLQSAPIVARKTWDVGAGLEFEELRTATRVFPLRVGFRYSQLPFRPAPVGGVSRPQRDRRHFGLTRSPPTISVLVVADLAGGAAAGLGAASSSDSADRELLADQRVGQPVRALTARTPPALQPGIPDSSTQQTIEAPLLMHDRKKAYVETYGCQMNLSDGELMQSILAASGYALAQKPEDADVILVNTCAIRDHAEQRVIGRVGELARIKQERPDVVIGVTGCMAQRMGTQLLERASYVELVMGPDSYRQLPEVLGKLRPVHAPARPTGTRRSLPVVERRALLDFNADENYEGIELQRASRVSAWVNVQRGCNYRCTYCIVPYTRGPEKNRDPQLILAEVRTLAEQGTSEVVLLGQTVNSYEYGEWAFPDLLRAVARVDGIRRVRFTSPHPNDFTPALVEVMAEEPAVCNSCTCRRNPVITARCGGCCAATPWRVTSRRSSSCALLSRASRFRLMSSWVSPAKHAPSTRLRSTSCARCASTTRSSTSTRCAKARRRRACRKKSSFRRPRRSSDSNSSLTCTAPSRRRSISATGRTVEVLIERNARSAGDLLGRTDSNKVVAFPGEETRIGQFTHVLLGSTSGATFRGSEVVEAPARVA
jgi:tRNA-2-methylthio-N6-dimethylallyladenosine synthase